MSDVLMLDCVPIAAESLKRRLRVMQDVADTVGAAPGIMFKRKNYFPKVALREVLDRAKDTADGRMCVDGSRFHRTAGALFVPDVPYGLNPSYKWKCPAEASVTLAVRAGIAPSFRPSVSCSDGSAADLPFSGREVAKLNALANATSSGAYEPEPAAALVECTVAAWSAKCARPDRRSASCVGKLWRAMATTAMSREELLYRAALVASPAADDWEEKMARHRTYLLQIAEARAMACAEARTNVHAEARAKMTRKSSPPPSKRPRTTTAAAT
jgi:hypothetical protein